MSYGVGRHNIKHYCRVVTAIAKTLEIQGEIDQFYPEVEKEAVGIVIASGLIFTGLSRWWLIRPP